MFREVGGCRETPEPAQRQNVGSQALLASHAVLSRLGPSFGPAEMLTGVVGHVTSALLRSVPSEDPGLLPT